MKIALLNFPFDNNYGGNLQRYALMQVLQGMGYDVTHLQTSFYERIPGRCALYTILKRLARRVLKKNKEGIFREFHQNRKYAKEIKAIKPFYDKYIKHTQIICSYQELKKFDYFEAYIVGSDQVWRRSMSYKYPFSSMFLEFLKDKHRIKRIAYGVSFGTSEDEISDSEKPELAELYKMFDAVSIREDSGFQLLKKYGWNHPKAIQVLDPTLLLPMQWYSEIIDEGKTLPLEGDMFCYVLDSKKEIDDIINEVALQKHLRPFRTSIDPINMVSIEQWLRSFRDAKYIVTDSFHGFVFSIIFNKPVKLVYNKRRGNDRFDSLQRLLNYNPEDANIDWDRMNDKIKHYANLSRNFLRVSLETKE